MAHIFLGIHLLPDFFAQPAQVENADFLCGRRAFFRTLGQFQDQSTTLVRRQRLRNLKRFS